MTMPVAPSSPLAAEQPVRVRLLCAQGRVARVETAWRRLPVEQLWIGQPAQAIAPVLHRTLTICLQAHLGAAQQAVRMAARAAQHVPVDPAPPATDASIRLEAARDTLRRWLLDYPRAFGGAWATEALQAWKNIGGAVTLAAYCRAHIFGMAARDWLALDAAALTGWIAAQATLPAQWLQHGLAAPLRQQTLPAAVDLPAWASAHAGALLRGAMPAAPPLHAHLDVKTNGRDLPSALLLHRLCRLALACTDAAAPEQGGLRGGDIGIGWARTARGTLLHLARIERDRVTAYRILPPTRWNAAPGGIIAAALQGLAQTQAPRCAEQLLLLLDPCAPFEIALADVASQPATDTESIRNADHA
jgi:hypothetical protein